MSAHIVERYTIAYLLGMAQKQVGVLFQDGMLWRHGGEWHGCEELERMGAVLETENRRSVHYRYDGRMDAGAPEGAPVGFDEINQAALGRFDPVQVLKTCGYMDYQSCEHPEWKDSEAFAFLEALKDKAVQALPGYRDAKWMGDPASTEDAAGEDVPQGNDKCPVCGGEQMEGGFVEIAGMEARQGVFCLDCHTEWEEVYSFSRRENIAEAKEEAHEA
jgi:hypothetical protein